MLFLLFLELFVSSVADKLPVAPYNVKLYCRSGRSETLRSMNPTLCPTSSTSCGYFEFPVIEKKIKKNFTGIFECVDSSILMREEEDYDDNSANPYYELCDHRPRCHEIGVGDLNRQFLSYVIRAYGLRFQDFTANVLKFCCSLSHSNLARLIASGKDELALSASVIPVNCQNLQCSLGTVGCLYYEQTGARFRTQHDFTDFIDADNSEEYIDVKPVQLTWDESDLFPEKQGFVPRFKRKSTSHLLEEFGQTPTNETSFDVSADGYYCVQMHLNDEVYRYCMMIYAQKPSSRCIDFEGYKVCCCFVHPYESTCDPLLIEASVDPSSATSFASSKLNKTSVSTTIPPTTTQVQNVTEAPILFMNQRTRCRTVTMTESRPNTRFKNKPRARKRIICDDIRKSESSFSNSFKFSIIFGFIFILR